jgi:hypothetical protein
MKGILAIVVLLLCSLSSLAQRLNIRVSQTQLRIATDLPGTEEDWPCADSAYRSHVEDGFAETIPYRSGFIFDNSLRCIIQRTIFLTNSIPRVDSLLRNMNFIKIKDGFADTLLHETSGLEIENEYFGETEECLLRAYIKPDLMVGDDGTIMVYVEIAGRYHRDGEEKEKPD